MAKNSHAVRVTLQTQNLRTMVTGTSIMHIWRLSSTSVMNLAPHDRTDRIVVHDNVMGVYDNTWGTKGTSVPQRQHLNCALNTWCGLSQSCHMFFWFHQVHPKKLAKSFILGPWWLFMITWQWNRFFSIVSRKLFLKLDYYLIVESCIYTRDIILECP